MPVIETTLTDNKNLGTKVWYPFYFNRYDLGNAYDGSSFTNAEDGMKHVYNLTEALSGGSTVGMGASQDSDINCNKIYDIDFTDSGGLNADAFVVHKSDNIGTIEDPVTGDYRERIYARLSPGTTSYWPWEARRTGTISIDVGVYIMIPDEAAFNSADEYRIITSTKEEIDKKKLWHGGYSTFLQLPNQEGASNSTSIIPADLRGKQITVAINMGDRKLTVPSSNSSPVVAAKVFNTVGYENRLTVNLEWNVNSEAPDNGVAAGDDSLDYRFPPGAKNTWQIGPIQWSEKDTTSSSDMLSEPVTTIPASIAGGGTTGTTQTYNVSASGKLGFPRFVAQFNTDIVPYSDFFIADNQYIKLIIILN